MHRKDGPHSTHFAAHASKGAPSGAVSIAWTVDGRDDDIGLLF